MHLEKLETTVDVLGEYYVIPYRLARRTASITRKHSTNDITEIQNEIFELDSNNSIQNEDCLYLKDEYDYSYDDLSKITIFMIINVIENESPF